MRLRIHFFICILFFCFLPYVFASSLPPDSNQVITKWESLKQEMKQQNDSQSLISWRDKIVKELTNLPRGISLFMSLAFFSLLILIIYLAVIKLTPFYQNDTSGITGKKIRNNTESDLQYEFLSMYNKAQDKVKQGNFCEAVLILHKASILFLISKKIILINKEYTNKEIRQLLSRQRYYNAFQTIADYSELIAFKGDIIAPDICYQLINLFRRDYEVK